MCQKPACCQKSEGEMVTITRDEYAELKDAEKLLDALYAAGVNNWEGFEEALDIRDADND